MSKWTLVRVILGVAGIIGLAFGVHGMAAKPKITERNVEAYVRQSIDNLGLGVKKVAEKNVYFAYQVVAQTGISITISRLKDHEQFLFFTANIEVSPEQEMLFEKLPDTQRQRLGIELQLEAARSKIAMEPIQGKNNLLITRRRLIRSFSSEVDLEENISEVNYAAIIIRNTIAIDFMPPLSIPNTEASPH